MFYYYTLLIQDYFVSTLPYKIILHEIYIPDTFFAFIKDNSSRKKSGREPQSILVLLKVFFVALDS